VHSAINILSLRDNAKPTIAKQILRELIEYKYEILSDSSYFPDISPTDYHLFKYQFFK
jgi:hypothetical protein